MKIGLLIQDLSTEYSVTIIHGCRKYCLENDIQLFIFPLRSKEWDDGEFDYQHYACKSLATKNNLDGIILITSTYCQSFKKEKHAELVNDFSYLPLVSFGEKIPHIPSVTGNSKIIFKQLLNHLEKEHNCKNIYFMRPHKTSSDILERFTVYKEYMESKNLSFREKIIYANYSYEEAQKALEKMYLSKSSVPFDALVCCNDDLALGSIDYFRSIGVHVPEDVKVTGFDNQFRCNTIKPSLTSIDMLFEEQAYQAAKMLHNKIVNPKAKVKNCCLESKIELRESCGCANNTQTAESSEGKYFQLREQVYKYQYFLQDLQVTDETEKIKELILKYYRAFGISSCICCIYDHPKKLLKNQEFDLPDKASIFFAYNEEKEYSYSFDTFLNPNCQMYPEDFVFTPGKEIIVTSLFNQEYQYGYLIYTPGKMNYNTYELISSTTGISLANNLVFSEKVQETEKLNSEKKTLETESYFDEMTGVMNRRGLFKFAMPSIRNSLERGLTGGIIFGDMDHLKLINDNYGHEAGDRAIIGEVSILKEVFRTNDIIARLGGDEFVIVACGLTPEAFKQAKIRLEETTKRYNENNKEKFDISISLGYVEFTEEDFNLDLLIKLADEKQYKEKVKHHKNRK